MSFMSWVSESLGMLNSIMTRNILDVGPATLVGPDIVMRPQAATAPGMIGIFLDHQCAIGLGVVTVIEMNTGQTLRSS